MTQAERKAAARRAWERKHGRPWSESKAGRAYSRPEPAKRGGSGTVAKLALLAAIAAGFVLVETKASHV